MTIRKIKFTEQFQVIALTIPMNEINKRERVARSIVINEQSELEFINYVYISYLIYNLHVSFIQCHN